MPRRPLAPALAAPTSAPSLAPSLAPALVVTALGLVGCLDPGSIAASATDTDDATTRVDVGETTLMTGETGVESTSSTTGEGPTSAAETRTSTAAESDTAAPETTGETAGDGDLPFDPRSCPASSAIEMIVPGRAYLVASDTVGLYWQASAGVTSVQIWLSSDGGESYPYLVDEVPVAGEGPHLEPWDSTLTKIEVAEAEGAAKPAGYRMVLAAFDGDGQVIGCSEGEESFEIRGWPASAFETVADVALADPKILAPIDQQTTPEALATDVVDLNLSHWGITDLGGLAHFVELETLVASVNEIAAITELSWMTKVKTLRIDYNAVSAADLPALGTLSSLRALDLSNNKIGDSITALPSLPSLVSLKIAGNGLTDAAIAALAPFPALESLDVRCNQLHALESLPALPALKVLTAGCNEVTVATGLPSAPNLTELYLDDNALVTPAGLPLLPHLAILDLHGNDLVTLKGLPAYPALTSLSAAFNVLSDLNGLPTLPLLEELYLSGNHLTDVTALKGRPSLKKLVLADNNLQAGVLVLADLPNLTHLDLTDNPNIACADQSTVKAAVLAKNPGATVWLSAQCK
ncbi:MAG: hypothetical protein R3B09_18010 [Nannocystaceae bacterium]